MDYEEQGRAAGIAMLYLSKRAPETNMRRLSFDSVPKVA